MVQSQVVAATRVDIILDHRWSTSTTRWSSLPSALLAYRARRWYNHVSSTNGQQGGTMRKTKPAVLWVVYKMTVHGTVPGPNAVCEQAEWDEMELRRPGFHALIRAGMTSETEAERLARESPGGTIPMTPRLKPRH